MIRLRQALSARPPKARRERAGETLPNNARGADGGKAGALTDATASPSAPASGYSEPRAQRRSPKHGVFFCPRSSGLERQPLRTKVRRYKHQTLQFFSVTRVSQKPKWEA